MSLDRMREAGWFWGGTRMVSCEKGRAWNLWMSCLMVLKGICGSI